MSKTSTPQVFRNDEAVMIASRGSILILPHADALAIADQIVAMLRPAMRKLRFHKLWSAEDDEMLRAMWEAGAMAPEIAAKLGRGPKTVWNRRSALGLPTRARGGNLAAARAARAAKKPRAV